MNFSTKNLEALTDAEREEYYLTTCERLGFDPRARFLQYQYMDDGSGNGTKHLVLYLLKGGTDKLRDIHGINVSEMSEKVIGDVVLFTAKGTNKSGRMDIAVGASTIGGLRGRFLSNSIMAAQTKATRRLTIQLAGAGLLDESEINDGQNGTVAIENAPQPLSEIGQPVEVSGAPGADITGTALKMPPAAPKTPAKATPEPAPASIARVASLPSPEAKPLPNPAAGLKPLPVHSMAGPDGAMPPNATEAPAPEKTRRRRRTKAEMAAVRAAESVIDPKILAAGDALVKNIIESTNKDIRKALESTSAVAIADASAVDAGVSVATATPEIRAAAAPEELREALGASQAETPSVSQAPPEKSSTVVGDLPNADQMKAFVERLTVYRNDVLPKGGMVPSHGMGVNKKVREFFKVACPGTEDLKALTVNQWETVLNFMDKTVAEHGPRKLVEIMEYNIGATDEPTNG